MHKHFLILNVSTDATIFLGLHEVSVYIALDLWLYRATRAKVIMYFVLSFQVGEFFPSAQNTAVAHQRELEVQTSVEGSIDSPLLLEQVYAIALYFCLLLYLFGLFLLLTLLSKFMFGRRQHIR